MQITVTRGTAAVLWGRRSAREKRAGYGLGHGTQGRLPVRGFDPAMFGGRPAVRPQYRRLEWPVVTQADKDAVLRVLDSRKFTVGAKNGQEISALEYEWSAFCDIRYAVAARPHPSQRGEIALECLRIMQPRLVRRC